MYESLFYVWHCDWVFATFAHRQLGRAPARPTASLDCKRMDDWITLMNSRRRQKNFLWRNKESFSKNTQRENLISIIIHVTCALLCVTCPQKLSPLLTFDPSRVCGLVWTAHNSCLLFLRNRLFIISWGCLPASCCQHEAGSLQVLCSLSQKITLHG